MWLYRWGEKTFHCVRWGASAWVVFLLHTSVWGFRRRCSAASRRPRTVSGGALSSPSQAGSRTPQSRCSTGEQVSACSVFVQWVGHRVLYYIYDRKESERNESLNRTVISTISSFYLSVLIAESTVSGASQDVVPSIKITLTERENRRKRS